MVFFKLFKAPVAIIVKTCSDAPGISLRSSSIIEG